MRKKRRKDKDVGGSSDMEVARLGTSLRPLLPVICVAAIICAAVVGLERLKSHVHSLPLYHPVVRVELRNPPEWVEREQWAPRILSSVQLPAGDHWMDDMLLRTVATDLAGSGWVREVRCVEKRMDGTIAIECDYRRPIAMLRTKQGEKTIYLPVDADGVRLPEVYDRVGEQSGWLRIFGVQSVSPQINQPFHGEDAQAAIRLAALITSQEFGARVNAIDVSNFRGRLDRSKDHILWGTWDPQGETQLWRAWGSAIGEEIEEPTPAEKLRSIAILLTTPGQQAFANADVSVFANGVVITPSEDAVQTADRSLARDR